MTRLWLPAGLLSMALGCTQSYTGATLLDSWIAIVDDIAFFLGGGEVETVSNSFFPQSY